MSESGQSGLELPRDTSAPGRARRWLAESFRSEHDAEELERAILASPASSCTFSRVWPATSCIVL